MLRLMSWYAITESSCRRRNYCLNPPERKKQNYYEILQLQRNCTQQEIRNAFVKLSKQYHPDVKDAKPNNEKTARFVQISEAYQTLIKPKTREHYDFMLETVSYPSAASASSKETEMYPGEIYKSWEVKPKYNPNPGPYYGFEGLKRVSNLRVALVLATIGLISTILGFFTLKYSFAMKTAKLDEISEVASSHHENVISNAKKYGNQEQLRRMIKRMKGGREDT